MEGESSSLELALADIEMIRSAYPDETASDDECCSSFPLHVTLQLSETAYIALEFVKGYPTTSNIQIAQYRYKDAAEYTRVKQAAVAVQQAATECLHHGLEGGLACCAAAFQAWNADKNDDGQGAAVVLEERDAPATKPAVQSCNNRKVFEWISGEPLLDRKSTFQAHVCRIDTEADVRPALNQLMHGNSRLHRASHPLIYAYRFTETIAASKNSTTTIEHGPAAPMIQVLKHDNDDDGEDGAGSRLAHLLQLRHDNGILIVVSRWYGGIQLGSKRFVHIVNVARELLVAEIDNKHINT